MRTLNILIIDDHPLTCTGYKIFLDNATEDGILPKCNSEMVYDAKEAFEKMKNITKKNPKYDIILLDIQLPPYPEKKIFSGEDLGTRIRELNSTIKIIVLTSLNDNHKLYNIFKTLNPEGLIVKSDIDEINFISAIRDVLSDIPYYSKTFSKLIRNQFSKEYVLDDHDRELLYLLSIGVASKDIPNYLPWSPSKVEKQKRLLREKFEVDEKSSLALVNAAKKAGFL